MNLFVIENFGFLLFFVQLLDKFSFFLYLLFSFWWYQRLVLKLVVDEKNNYQENEVLISNKRSLSLVGSFFVLF